MIADLPRELAANIFDHLGSCAAGAAAAQTCRALNDAWYDSRHWSSEPLTIPILSNKNAPDVVRASTYDICLVDETSMMIMRRF